MTSDPAGEYRQRLQARRETRARLDRQDRQLAYARLLTFAAGAVTAILAWQGWLSFWLLVAPAVLFVWLLQRHDRILAAGAAVDRGIAFYERGLARLEDRWIGGGNPGERFADPDHPYAADLDLFGRGSLFELLSITRTTAGEETLAAWLKTPALAGEIAARHDALRELTPALDLRETLAVTAADVRRRVHGDVLSAWGHAPQRLDRRWRGLALALSLGSLGSLAYFAADGSVAPLLAVLAVRAWLVRQLNDDIEAVMHGADTAARELSVLRVALSRLETESFSAPKLAALRHQLDSAEETASTTIATLGRYVEMHDWAHNIVFAPIAALLLWQAHLAWTVEAWRMAHGRHVATWLAVVGEFEALSSLSTYAFEHPGDPFPVVVDAEARFEGTALGHPLLPAASMVRNDVTLTPATPLLVVSGSNMSGKSTLLRTVGINAVLALAGAPVRAASLRLSPMAIGATLRIQDSLQEGCSRFYAEITRVRRLTDLARGPLPLLFLLDELFHGTNSHDRVVGAAGVLRQLVERGAIGLVTTHDLALTAMTAELGDRAANVHFEEWFEGGDMRFDYRMKPGPVTRSNALALMRAVGLEVEDD